VIAHAAADDQHVAVAQRHQRLADGDMFGWVQAGFQRQLHHRNIGVGIDQQEGDEHAMVQAALSVLFRRDPRLRQQVAHRPRQIG
jgi:hypothetical protein